MPVPVPPPPQLNSNLAPHQVILRPLVTEKGMHRANRNNAYAFEVVRVATKADIRRAVPCTHVTTHLEPIEDPLSHADAELDRTD